MATTLNHLIPAHAPQLLGEHLARAGAGIKPTALVKSAGADFDDLPLMARGQRLADALVRHLPSDFAEAAPLLVASMGAPMALDAKGEPVAAGDVPSGFFYLPHSLYIAQRGLDHLDIAIDAQPLMIFGIFHRSLSCWSAFETVGKEGHGNDRRRQALAADLHVSAQAAIELLDQVRAQNDHAQ